MPFPWSLRGLRDGVVTTPWPRRPDQYQSGFPATVEVQPGVAPAASGMAPDDLKELCPTHAILVDGDQLRVDHGRCIGCGRCIDALPLLFEWRPGADTAEVSREQLIVPELPETDEAIAEVRARLAERVRRLHRSIHIRHVDAGSDGSEEWEVQALANPIYDVHRLGIFFTASPRHADILLVTGVSTPSMRIPVLRTREAMPDPVVVIAAGTDAISGGLFRHGYSSGGGVGSLLDVDVWVPGSPPSPFSLLHGILLALGRVPEPVGFRE